MRRIVLILALGLAAPALAGQPAPAQKENFFKRAGKQIGKDAKAGWKQAKKQYPESAKAGVRDGGRAAKRVGKEMQQSSKKTAKAAKETF
jgi:hypothetical protein